MEIWEYFIIAGVIICLAVHEAKRARFDFLLIPWWKIIRHKDYFGGSSFLIHYFLSLIKWIVLSLFFSVFILVPVFELIIKATNFNALFIGSIVSVLFYYLLLRRMQDPVEEQNIKDFFSSIPSNRVEFAKQLIKLTLSIVPDVMRKFFQPLIDADESIVDGCVELLYTEYSAGKSDIIQTIYRNFPNNLTDDAQRLKQQVKGLRFRGETQQVLCILTEKVRRLGYISAKVEIDRSLRMLTEDKRSAARQPVPGEEIQFDYHGKNFSGRIVECSSNGKGGYISTEADIPQGTSIVFKCHQQIIAATVMHCALDVNQSAGIGIKVDNGVNLAQMLMA